MIHKNRRRKAKQASAYIEESARAINRSNNLGASTHAIMGMRMANPNADELLRMVPEKMIAFSAAGMLLCQHALQIGLRFGPGASGSLGLLTATHPWQFWERYVGRSMALGTAILKAQGSVMEHLVNAVTRNQRRLSS